jgi:hypothetical protein
MISDSRYKYSGQAAFGFPSAVDRCNVLAVRTKLRNFIESRNTQRLDPRFSVGVHIFATFAVEDNSVDFWKRTKEDNHFIDEKW